MKAPIFKAMLHFIYRDCLLEPEQDSIFLAEHLLAVADRYGLDRLRLLCEDKLCNSIDIENVTTILVLAEQHNFSQLKGACLKFLARPEVLLAVVTTVGFKDLIKTCPWILKELPIQ
ncbi:BTB-POZ and MATH domain 2 [Carex littledalei]|uniref:BTB-POZ and MATH domain 2 n=1 Tax=Carex littledalei TaxID=544730 RepID=A0A833VM47_9POAL|nr:BTB-POZ and MATH domain 2 [Carex littledalei]